MSVSVHLVSDLNCGVGVCWQKPNRIEFICIHRIHIKVMMDYNKDEDEFQVQKPLYEEGDVMNRVWQCMALHPKYHTCFINVHNTLLTDGGPLNNATRHYIAIKAASRHGCTDLMEYHQTALRSSSLPGIEKLQKQHVAHNPALKKIQKLDKLNRILAHQPWRITKYHIKELTKTGSVSGERWSLSELLQGTLLLAHFHAFSSFVLGCGVMEHPYEANEETTVTQHQGSSSFDDPNEHELDIIVEEESEVYSDDLPDEVQDNIPKIVNKMKVLGANAQELEIAELARRFEKIESVLAVEDEKQQGVGNSLKSRFNSIDQVMSLDVKKSTSNLEDFHYVDFIHRENKKTYPTFRIGDFDWEKAYTVIEQFYNHHVVGKMLDRKFRTIDDLTYMTIGSYTQVDTTLFRRAIKCYVHCLYGIRHDDYDYSMINQLLPRRLKKYIKAVSCYPEGCISEEYEAIMTDFLRSEKVHVCLLVCEARLQAELLYAMKAISSYYTMTET